MARTRYDDPDEDDGDHYDDYGAETDYDPDDPETYPAGLYVDDERAVVSCPHCRAEIDEEAEQCPRCGAFISEEDAPGGGRSATWIVLMALALLAALALALAG
ncbi:MAG: zinc-ribbon domain-containing protein [Planctomycetes bacterium]|nr:zinc-ribbon domain-containing protein [Planctomycetota bacterium]